MTPSSLQKQKSLGGRICNSLIPCLLFLLGGALFLAPVQAQVLESKVAENLYIPIDFTAIRLEANWVPRKAEIQGFLGFDGTGDCPRITLYETQEALQFHRDFKQIEVDDENAMRLIEEKFGRGAESWRVLQGCFVQIQGTLDVVQKEDWSIARGRIKEVRSIVVLNNGLELVTMRQNGQSEEILFLQKILNQLPAIGKTEHLNFPKMKFTGVTVKEGWQLKASKEREDLTALGETRVRDSLARKERLIKICFSSKPDGLGNSVVLFMDGADGSLLFVYRGK